MHEKCDGMQQCQKDAAINEATRAPLSEAGGRAQAVPYAAEAEEFREYQRVMEAQAKASIAAREAKQRILAGQQIGTGSVVGLGYAQSLSEHEQRAMHGERLFRRSEVLAVVLAKQRDLEKMGIHFAGLLAVDYVIRVIADME